MIIKSAIKRSERNSLGIRKEYADQKLLEFNFRILEFSFYFSLNYFISTMLKVLIL